jgi:hypothetical protein
VQRLLQRVPGALVVAVGPEEAEEAVAADPLRAGRGEHREQQHGLALRRRSGERGRPAGDDETAERLDPVGRARLDVHLTRL